jgi:hypothetical protein
LAFWSDAQSTNRTPRILLKDANRRGLQPLAREIKRPIEFKLNESVPGDQESLGVQLHAYFRGQQAKQGFNVVLNRRPYLILTEPATASQGKASFLVRADPKLQVGLGHLIILLDCSGSMEGKRFNKAREAINQLLTSLPVGIKITLRVFSDDKAKMLEYQTRPEDSADDVVRKHPRPAGREIRRIFPEHHQRSNRWASS